jgi:2-polyprenyl-3-methyl-5-hydroxy-6-metoxy-1,4-benzoquinol methylase
MNNSNLVSFRQIDFEKTIQIEQIERIRRVEYFCDSQYSNMQIASTLNFYTKRYVEQLFEFLSLTKSAVVIDVGAGFGWLSMAFAFSTEGIIVAVDSDYQRLKAGKKIARILGVEDQILWIVGSAVNLPIKKRIAEVTYCIEVLEHLQKDPSAIINLCFVTANLLVLTTPNLWFPIISHDTKLPICHWLPRRLRKPYAKLFGRLDSEQGNLFWSPFSLKRHMKEFCRVSRFLHYLSYDRYRSTFPLYMPYGRCRYITGPSPLQENYYKFISKFGSVPPILCPSLAGVFQRKNILSDFKS